MRGNVGNPSPPPGMPCMGTSSGPRYKVRDAKVTANPHPPPPWPSAPFPLKRIPTLQPINIPYAECDLGTAVVCVLQWTQRTWSLDQAD